MPLLSTGGVELLVPVARAGCEYSSHLLFDVGNVLVSSSVTTYQCPAMTNLPLHLGAQGHDELSVVRTGSVQVCRVGDEELLRGNGERARFRRCGIAGGNPAARTSRPPRSRVRDGRDRAIRGRSPHSDGDVRPPRG